MIQNKSIFGELNSIPHWYALHTRYRYETKVHNLLSERKIINYLPLNTEFHKWSDRYKKVHLPLFSCYIFVFLTLRDRSKVLQINGVINFVSFNGIPATIPENQIATIKQILEVKQKVSQADYFTPGKTVRVIQGPLKGIEGTLVAKNKKTKLIIKVDSLKKAISVEIDYRDLMII